MRLPRKIDVYWITSSEFRRYSLHDSVTFIKVRTNSFIICEKMCNYYLQHILITTSFNITKLFVNNRRAHKTNIQLLLRNLYTFFWNILKTIEAWNLHVVFIRWSGNVVNELHFFPSLITIKSINYFCVTIPFSIYFSIKRNSL